MDGAINTTSKLIQLDIADAAYRLWEERYEELLCSGEEYGNGPSLEAAWDTYVERGAFNYAWWNMDDELNADGRAARARFEAAWNDCPGVYGMLHAS
jgi:hypothetical protein